jgi:hypothetical protein
MYDYQMEMKIERCNEFAQIHRAELTPLQAQAEVARFVDTRLPLVRQEDGCSSHTCNAHHHHHQCHHTHTQR